MTAARTHGRPYRAAYSPRWAKSVPEEQHTDQDERRGNRTPDKVHPMDTLTATEPGVFFLDIKTNPISPIIRSKCHQLKFIAGIISLHKSYLPRQTISRCRQLLLSSVRAAPLALDSTIFQTSSSAQSKRTAPVGISHTGMTHLSPFTISNKFLPKLSEP